MSSPSDSALIDARPERDELCPLLLASIRDYAIIAMDPEGRVTRSNTGCEEIFGYSEVEILGEPIARLFPPEAVEGGELERLFRTAAEQGRAEYEGSLVRKDGSRFWGSGVITPLRDSSGQLVGFGKLVRDITERREAEARLRLLESVVASAHDAVMITEPEPLDEPGPRIQYVNPAFTRQTGYQPEEVIGRSPRFLQGPETNREALSRIRAALERGEAVREEIINYRKEGSPFWVDLSIVPILDAEGRLTHWASVQRETTPRREAEEAVIRATPLGVIALDPDGRVVMWNPAAERIFGWTAEEARGRPLPIVPEEMQEEHRRIREAAMRGETITGLETYRQRKDGSRVEVELSTAALHDGRGQVRGTLVLHEDITERKRAEEALRQTTEMLEALVRAAPVAITALDLEGRVEIWNPAAERIFGWTEEEARGRVTPIVPPDRQDELRHELEEAARGAAIVGIETERQRKDGTRITVNIATAPIRNAAGEIRGMMSLLTDVTERKEAEEKERRLAAILETTPDFVATSDPEGRILYLNGAGRRMLGIGPDDPLTGLDVSAIHPEWALGRILREAIPTAIRDGSWAGETALLHRDGTETPVSLVILSHTKPTGEVEFFSSIARDISERRRREEELRFLAEASQMFVSTLEYESTLEGLARLAVSTIADVCVVDIVEDSGVRQLTLAHRDPEKEKELQSLKREMPPARRPAGMEAVIRTGVSELVEEVSPAWLRAAARDEDHLGTLRRLAPRSAMIVPLVARERTLGAVGFFIVEGDRRFGPGDLALAEELVRRAALAIDNARLYEESRQATRIRDEVLRIVAHDLRNPLNAVSLSAGILEELIPEGNEPERKQLAIIGRSVERANRLIQDLLDVARMEAGQLTIERHREETVPLINEAVELHRSLADEKGLKLIADIPSSLPPIEVDRDRILQVFDNIIGNAIKFTPEGGTITVRARPAEKEIRFSISDTGPGIPEDELPHIFDPFWQAKRGAREGAGLGLAIARRIVQAHGGRLWVDSEVGVGTTFYVALPVPETTGES